MTNYKTTVCLRYILGDGKAKIFYSNAITNDNDQESDVEETGINIDKAKSTYWVTALSLFIFAKDYSCNLFQQYSVLPK